MNYSHANNYFQVKLVLEGPTSMDEETAVAMIGLLNLSLGHGFRLLGPAREAVDVTDRVRLENGL